MDAAEPPLTPAAKILIRHREPPLGAVAIQRRRTVLDTWIASSQPTFAMTISTPQETQQPRPIG
jgi:hypothetical protein